VPADPSSSIPAALTQLTHADPLPLRPAHAPHLLAYLATIRRTLARLDAEALATAIGTWLADRDHHDHPTPAAAGGRGRR
jgi:hypothetical protein